MRINIRSLIHVKEEQDDNKVKNALKSRYVNDVQVQVPSSPHGIPTYIRRGISFGKLSRVPMCNIQDAGKLYMPNAMVFKII